MFALSDYTDDEKLVMNEFKLAPGTERNDEESKKDELKTKLERRASVSSEQSGDELFCLDEHQTTHTNNNNYSFQPFTCITESDEELLIDEDERRQRTTVADDDDDEEDAETQKQQQMTTVSSRKISTASSKRTSQQQQQQQQQQQTSNNKTVRDLIARMIEFSTESEITIWEDVLLNLRLKECAQERFVLDVHVARHLEFRIPLVEWILDVCAEAQFGPATADVAVEYMVCFVRINILFVYFLFFF